MGSGTKHVITIRDGELVWHKGQQYTIQFLADLNTVYAKSHADGQTRQLPIDELGANKDESQFPNAVSLIEVPQKDWDEAQRRFEIIKPLIQATKRKRTVRDVHKRAKEFGVGISTLYRWLEAYETSGLLSALTRTKRSDRGRARVNNQIEDLINEVIQEEYLKEQRIKSASIYEEIQSRCRKAKIKPPHINTVRNRIKALPEALKVKKRRGRHAAKQFEPIRGHFPGADWPLAYVQIDHTPLDIILVDDETRLPVGRPYITLALDVFSRMVAGFYMSYDPPSVFSAGMCIANSVLPKEKFIAEFNLASDWPIQGKMKILHVDNALEFRSDVLARACDQHQIDIQWRPVREPQYGGHVERVFRTISTRIHELPGTTFSSIAEREKYQSDKYSAFTLAEFEAWLTTFIVDKYHQSFHSEINTSPLKRFEQGVLGDNQANILGVGLPPRVVDQESFRIDFMPFVKRTIQQYGMRNDKIYYYHDVLRPWINAKEPNDETKKRRFIFHYDPRDISKFYFWDPTLKQYFTIAYRDNTHPPISLWELRAANRKAREDGIASIDEDILFDTHERLKQMTADAVKKTDSQRKKLRREQQRKREYAKEAAKKGPAKTPPVPLTMVEVGEEEETVFAPFEMIRE